MVLLLISYFLVGKCSLVGFYMEPLRVHTKGQTEAFLNLKRIEPLKYRLVANMWCSHHRSPCSGPGQRTNHIHWSVAQVSALSVLVPSLETAEGLSGRTSGVRLNSQNQICGQVICCDDPKREQLKEGKKCIYIHEQKHCLILYVSVKSFHKEFKRKYWLVIKKMTQSC